MKKRNKKAIGILFAAMLLSSLLLFNTAIAAQPIELTYDFAEPVIGKTIIGVQEYDTVSIPGCDMYGAPGEPVLPVKTARILIPYGEEVQDIQVVPGEEIYLGEFYIEPGQEPVPFSFTGPVTTTQPDGVIYNSYKPFPEKIYSEVSVQGMKGYQILILNLYPVKYVPKARKLSYFDSMLVVVSTTASTPSELFRGVPEDRAEAAKIVDNPDALSTYDPAKASKPERSPLSPTDQYDTEVLAASASISKVVVNVSKHPATYEIPPVATGEYEIKYDDGTAEAGYSVSESAVGCIFAVCFTPPEYPVTVKKARVFIFNAGTPSTPIKIHVYEQASGSSAPGAELIMPFTVTPPGPGWYDIDLSGYNIVINSGSFAIGEEPTQGSKVYLGEDQSEPIDYRSWFYNVMDPQWLNWATIAPGDLMIRAIVESGGGTLFYPDFTDTDTPGSWRTWISTMNTGTTSTNVGLNIYYPNGVPAFTDPNYITLGPKAVHFFRPGITAGITQGSVEVSGDNLAGTCHQNKNAGEGTKAYAASTRGSSRLYFSDFTDTDTPGSWRTWIAVKNTGTTSTNVGLNIYNPNGVPAFTDPNYITLGSKAVHFFRPGITAGITQGSVEVSGNNLAGTCHQNKNAGEGTKVYNPLQA